jgi:protein-S-isoprenylcysteine O-methyltransferase Ste14
MNIDLDTIRRFLALVSVVSVPAWLTWLIIHPFVRFWRRIGHLATYVITGLTVLVVAFLLYACRTPILSIEFGANRVLWPFAAVLYAVATYLEIRCRKFLRFPILVGVPELNVDQGSRKLLTDGIYGRLRHPRYAAFVLAYLALALFTNYLASYVLVAVVALLTWATSLVEERELIDAFGNAYRRYQADVPRFIPRYKGSR